MSADRSRAALAACLLLAGSVAMGGGLSIPDGSRVSLGGGEVALGCGELAVGGTLALNTGAVRSVEGVNADGRIEGGSGTLDLSGRLQLSGEFVPGTSEVSLSDDCAAVENAIAGSSTFHALTVASASGRTLRFDPDSQQTVVHLTLTGADGTPLPVRTTGGVSRLVVTGTEQVFAVDVQNSHARLPGRWLAFGAPAESASIDGGGNDRWFLSGTFLTADLVPSRDNTIYEAQPENSNARGDLLVGRTPEGDELRGLVAFDLTGLPADARILSGQVTIGVLDAPLLSVDVGLHAVQTPWGEGTSLAAGDQTTGAPATPGDATWRHGLFPSGLWTLEGGDFASAAVSQASLAPGDTGFPSGPALVGLLQEWVDDPTANHGVLLLSAGTPAGAIARVGSRETPAFAPVLTIEYENAGLIFRSGFERTETEALP